MAGPIPFSALQTRTSGLDRNSLTADRSGIERFCHLLPVHKPGRETRPIIDNTNYYTGQDSKFLHCLLAPVVFRNAHVLKESLTLIRKLDEMRIPADHNIRFATFDVTALYPSIDLERG